MYQFLVLGALDNVGVLAHLAQEDNCLPDGALIVDDDDRLGGL